MTIYYYLAITYFNTIITCPGHDILMCSIREFFSSSFKVTTFDYVLLDMNTVVSEIECGVKRDPILEARAKALIQIGIGVINGEEKAQAAIHARE